MIILPTLRSPFRVAIIPTYVAAVLPQGANECRIILSNGKEFHILLPFQTTLGRLYGGLPRHAIETNETPTQSLDNDNFAEAMQGERRSECG